MLLGRADIRRWRGVPQRAWQMKIEIFDEKSMPEKVLRLALVAEYGAVSLYAVDSAGGLFKEGQLLRITAQGIHLSTGVDPDIGLPLETSEDTVVVHRP